MSEPIIRVENLSKMYRLGVTHTDLLSERLGNALNAVVNSFRRSNNDKLSIDNNLCSREDSFWALRNVSFEIQEGEVVGIIGANGAGKSTLLKVLSRITTPTTGQVEMNGRVASLLEVGTGFHPELTGRENIYLNGAILGMTRQEVTSKFDQIVSFAEVEKFIDTPVKRYSSGMYVRLAFSVAAHLEPEILLVDEVLAVGDISFQKKCIGKMEEVAGQGRTVLFVSHNMASVKRLCSVGILLEEGYVVVKNSTNEVIKRYFDKSVSTQAVVELKDFQHRTKSELQIVRVEILDTKLKPASFIYFEEDIIIKMTIISKKTFYDVRVGIEIYCEGVHLSTVHTNPMSFKHPNSSRTVCCRINGGVLLPGLYNVHVGAHESSTGKGLDWVPEATVVRVLDVSEKDALHRDEKEKGMVRMKVSWFEE